jgi:type II secretion system protein N
MIRKPNAKTVLVCLGIFLVFFVWRFPYRNLRGYLFGQVFKNTGVRLDAEDMGLSFFGWPGVVLYKATAAIPVNYQFDLDLAAEEVVARAGIGGLFPPAQLFSLSAYKLQKGGNLYIRASQSKSQVTGSLNADAVNLIQFFKVGMPEPIQGLLTATGSFNYSVQDFAKSTGDFDLIIQKLKVPGMNLQGIVLPEISWNEVKAKLTAKNGTLDIVQCQFGTPQSDLRGTLTGSIRLGQDIYSSYVNLVLRLQLTEKYKNDPQSATLVSFLKTFESTQKPGEYALKWAATPNEMSNNLMLALPTQAE